MVLDHTGKKILEISDLLKRNNVPFVGVSQSGIEFSQSATQEQIDAGNAIFAAFDWDADPVPQSVSPLQARRALRASNLLDYVNTSISQMSSEFQETWEYATEIRRDDPILLAVASDLQLSESQVDDLFKLAESI